MARARISQLHNLQLTARGSFNPSYMVVKRINIVQWKNMISKVDTKCLRSGGGGGGGNAVCVKPGSGGCEAAARQQPQRREQQELLYQLKTTAELTPRISQ